MKILRLLFFERSGLRYQTIMRITATKKRTLFNHLEKLKKAGIISNSWPVWKFQADPKNWQYFLQGENVQLHKFSFVMQLIKRPSWWEKRSNRLLRLKAIHFEKKVPWGNAIYQQLHHNNFLIQCFPRSIVFINQNHYWGESGYSCFIDAVQDTFKVIDYLKEVFQYDFVMDGVPHLQVKGNDYVQLRDVIAKRCEKSKKGFQVRIHNQLRAVVDFSIPLGLEFVNAKYGCDDQKIYSDFVKDVLETESTLSDVKQELQSEIGMLQRKTQEIEHFMGLMSAEIKPEEPGEVPGYIG